MKQSKSTNEHQQNNKSFLNKFKGKHNIVSKEGLLNLLQNKNKSLEAKINRPNSISSEPVNPNAKLKNIENNKINQIIKSRSLRKGSDSSVSKSVQLTELPKKLPAIQKIVSSTQNLRPKVASSPVQNFQTQNLQKPIKAIPIRIKQKKSQQKYMFELDRFAMDHLDFLQKFQERIKSKDPVTR